MFSITNSKAIAIAEEVITTHAPLILEALGLAENNDGILDRIKVIASPLTHEEPQSAIFYHVVLSRGLMGCHGSKYQEGSGRIEINAIAPFYFTYKGGYKDMKFVRVLMSRKKLRDHYIFLLAHEMRHYWQFLTGEIWVQGARMGSINFVPYEWRWEEQDANEFARDYCKSLK